MIARRIDGIPHGATTAGLLRHISQMRQDAQCRIGRGNPYDTGFPGEYIECDNIQYLWTGACADMSGTSRGEIVLTPQNRPTAGPDLASGYLDSKAMERAIAGIVSTQHRNKQGRGNRIYHLLVSMGEPEKGWPTIELLMEVERLFVVELGLGEHQRICAAHHEFGAFHLHIAVNRVHPQSLTCVFPRGDDVKIQRVVDRCMKDLGLDSFEPRRPSERALAYENRTWEESFERQTFGAIQGLIRMLDRAEIGWDSVHEAFAHYGLRIVPWESGLVITDAEGKNKMKASGLDRNFGKPTMERTFGPYAPYTGRQATRAETRPVYARHPLTRHEGQGNLWHAYLKWRMSSGEAGYGNSWKTYLNEQAKYDALAAAVSRTRAPPDTDGF